MKGVFRTTARGPNGTDIEMVARREIKFMPSIGVMLAVTPKGYFLRVDDVFWHCDRPDQIEVYLLMNGGAEPVSHMRKQGWQQEEV